MPETEVAAAPQPAPEAQPSGDVRNNGPQNASVSEFARRFMKSEPPPAPEAKVEAKAEPVVAEEKQETAEAVPVEPVETETESQVEEKPETEVEAEDKTDDVLSKSNSLTPEQQAVVDKRIGKAVAKQRKAERDAAELKLKIAELEAAKPVLPATVESPSLVPLPIGAPPLANINTIEGLQKLQSEAKQAIRFAEDALADIADGNPPPEGFDKRTLREVMRNARVTLEDQIPARANFLQTRQQMQQKAYEVLPFMKDKASAEYKEAQLIYERHPFLRNIPEGDFTVGLILKGIKAVEAERQANVAAAKKPAPNKPVISKPKPAGDQTVVSATGSDRTAGQSSEAQRKVAQELASLTKKGGASTADYAKLLSLKSQLRNST